MGTTNPYGKDFFSFSRIFLESPKTGNTLDIIGNKQSYVTSDSGAIFFSDFLIDRTSEIWYWKDGLRKKQNKRNDDEKETK
jgi:hypothetical protein